MDFRALASRVVNAKQVARFARLFVATLGTQLVAISGHETRDLVVAAVVAAAEVAFRSVVSS